jgi:hypothetical protein
MKQIKERRYPVNPTLISVLVAGIIIVIAAIAFALYKAGFRVDKLKVKLGLVEAEASRKKSETPPDKTTSDTKETAKPVGTSVRQQATDGGVIKRSGITAPAESAAKIDQHAKGEKSRIDESPIELT